MYRKKKKKKKLKIILKKKTQLPIIISIPFSLQKEQPDKTCNLKGFSLILLLFSIFV